MASIFKQRYTVEGKKGKRIRKRVFNVFKSEPRECEPSNVPSIDEGEVPF